VGKFTAYDKTNVLIKNSGGNRVLLATFAGELREYNDTDFAQALKELLIGKRVFMVPDNDNWDMNYPECGDKLYIKLTR
jgi:hypothetical protein